MDKIESSAQKKLALKTPLQFIDNNSIVSEKITVKKTHAQRRRHIVLFYEEPEYAALVSFRYIKSGLDTKSNCGYVSKDPDDIVRNEMIGNQIDFDELMSRGILRVVQFPDLLDYPKGSKKALKDIASLLSDTSGILPSDLPQGERQVVLDRTVLKCMHRVSVKKDIKRNMTLERQHHLNFGVFGRSSLLVTYPVNNILATAKGKNGIHSDWMELLVKKYDSVIFAFSLQEGGIALNLT